MPLGNLAGSATRLPAESRAIVDQQSSMLTYSYPAAAMPLDTMTSAVCRMSVSLTEQPNVFQSFQPMGGVRPSPLLSAWAGGMTARATMGTVATLATAASTTRKRLRTGPPGAIDIGGSAPNVCPVTSHVKRRSG